MTEQLILQIKTTILNLYMNNIAGATPAQLKAYKMVLSDMKKTQNLATIEGLSRLMIRYIENPEEAEDEEYYEG